jgi:hypothetical protein
MRIGGMKIFRDLTVFLNGVPLDKFADLMEPRLHGPWGRNRDKEAEAKRFGISEPAFYFMLEGDEERSPVALVMYLDSQDKSKLTVVNIVSSRKSELSIDEYNMILQRFIDEVLRPSIEGTAITLESNRDELEFAEIVPREILEKLRQFSVSANKSTGASHPLDQERWLDFVLASFRSGRAMSINHLERWLVEEGGWSEDWASDLTIQYEQALALLDYAAKH